MIFYALLIVTWGRERRNRGRGAENGRQVVGDGVNFSPVLSVPGSWVYVTEDEGSLKFWFT